MSLRNLGKPLDLGNDLRSHLRDVAAAHGDYQVAGTGDPGHGWCSLVPDRFIGHMCGARSNGIRHHGSVDPRNRILSVTADIHHDGFVGLFQRMCELGPKVTSAGIEVRLEANYDPTVANTGTSRDERI